MIKCCCVSHIRPQMAVASDDCSVDLPADSSDCSLVDQAIQSTPSGLLDCRTYYWRNFKHPGTIISYDRRHFQHTVTIGELYPSISAYIATFDGHMLLTWVGVECTVHHWLATSYRININVVNGQNPYEDAHNSVYLYTKVPPPISRFEPRCVHSIQTSDKVDSGTNTHTHLHPAYSMEVVSSFDKVQGSYLTNGPFHFISIPPPLLRRGNYVWYVLWPAVLWVLPGEIIMSNERQLLAPKPACPFKAKEKKRSLLCLKCNFQ